MMFRQLVAQAACVAIGIASAPLIGSCTSTPHASSDPPRAESSASSGATATKKPIRPRTMGSEFNRTSPLGTNLAPVVDYETSMPFVDLFKGSRLWTSTDPGYSVWNDGRAIDLDAHGWVRSLKKNQVARTLVLVDGTRPGGHYILLHDGEGDIAFDGHISVVEGESRPGRYVFRVRENRGVGFAITKTNPENPLRNIVVLPPGGSCEADDTLWCDSARPCPDSKCVPFEKSYRERIFHPKFLDMLEPYAVLRFMHWMYTNQSTVRTWAERPKVTDAQWQRAGVPIEVMIALSTRLRAEPWLNVPHTVDDEYVENFAKLVRDTLPEESRIWLEHSNEVWNTIYSQHKDVATCAAGKKQGGAYGAAIVCHAERSDEIFKTWHSIFGDSADRVIRVLGTQAGNTWTSELALSHRDLHERVDALAIAPYFGLIAYWDNHEEVARMSWSELIEKTETEYLPRASKKMRDDVALVNKYGIDLVAYEGGQHFVGIANAAGNDTINAMFDRINRDPKMGDFYREYLGSWREAGGKLFVNYRDCGPYSRYGRFGILEYVDQPRGEAPKFNAVMEFIDENPRWW